MARYYFYLIDSVDVLLDPEGVVLPEAAIAGAALLQARDCMAHDVKGGQLRLGYRIDVHDENDGVVHSLSFADALEILPQQ